MCWVLDKFSSFDNFPAKLSHTSNIHTCLLKLVWSCKLVQELNNLILLGRTAAAYCVPISVRADSSCNSLTSTSVLSSSRISFLLLQGPLFLPSYHLYPFLYVSFPASLRVSRCKRRRSPTSSPSAGILCEWSVVWAFVADGAHNAKLLCACPSSSDSASFQYPLRCYLSHLSRSHAKYSSTIAPRYPSASLEVAEV